MDQLSRSRVRVGVGGGGRRKGGRAGETDRQRDGRTYGQRTRRTPTPAPTQFARTHDLPKPTVKKTVLTK